MEKLNDFFVSENKVSAISEEDYENVAIVINTAKAFARMSYQSVYIIDFFKKNFLYVSENPLFLCGLNPESVKQMGYSFYYNHVPNDEISLLLEINRAGFAFFHKTPLNERINLFISYDFHIKNKDYKALINHKLSPIILDRNGNIWLAACVVSLSPNKKEGNIEVHKNGQLDYWAYSLQSRQWEKQKPSLLSSREKEVVSYSVQGFSEKTVAEKIYLKNETIKYHKQNLFRKLGVKSLVAAMSIITNKKMI